MAECVVVPFLFIGGDSPKWKRYISNVSSVFIWLDCNKSDEYFHKCNIINVLHDDATMPQIHAMHTVFDLNCEMVQRSRSVALINILGLYEFSFHENSLLYRLCEHWVHIFRIQWHFSYKFPTYRCTYSDSIVCRLQMPESAPKKKEKWQRKLCVNAPPIFVWFGLWFSFHSDEF